MSAAALIVVDPGGHRKRMPLEPLPFRIGRQADNHLVLRDSRASRNHARILLEGADYLVEDTGSRYGVWVNGRRVERHVLRDGDRIEFGVPDSYQLVFAGAAHLGRLMAQMEEQTAPGLGGNLAKLKSVLEVARSLQTGFSLEDVLRAVVDAALTITGAERGFLLLRDGDELEVKVARNRSGGTLDEDDLRIPRRVIRRALDSRRELLSMNFDPHAVEAEQSVADLELRSVVCVPLVRVSTAAPEATSLVSAGSETVGLLYMDSRLSATDLAGGNRELLQTLAIEASTVLENARLLEEERAKLRMDEELEIARGIQQSLLPRALPCDGWFRAAGSSVPTLQVGGDYYDLLRAGEDCWAAVVTDVSGKGVGSALLASLLQGAFLTFAAGFEELVRGMSRLNRFLNERTGGEKYATVFYCTVERNGAVRYINAGHCAPLLVRRGGTTAWLEATGMPVGLLDTAEYAAGSLELEPGDKLVLYSDGLTEAANPSEEFFGRRRLRETATASSSSGCREMHDQLLEAVLRWTGGAPQADDMTLVVVERGE